jgi:hypothetical protein
MKTLSRRKTELLQLMMTPKCLSRLIESGNTMVIQEPCKESALDWNMENALPFLVFQALERLPLLSVSLERRFHLLVK